MSNRFHNKFHRFNHHSTANQDPQFPDAGYDPIASFNSPFQGEFFSHGDIITTQSLSAYINAWIGNNLTVGYDALVKNNLVVDNNFTVSGSSSNIDTLVYITSAVEIFNSGTGPALRVEQKSLSGINGLSGEPIVHFLNNGTSSFIVDGRPNVPGYVGINTSTPNERLTIVGNISAVGNTITTGNAHVSGSSNLEGNLIVDTNVLFVDVSANKIGVNTSTPNEALTIVGNISSIGNTITTGNAYVSGSGNVQGNLIVDTNVLFVDVTTNRIGINTSTPNEALTIVGNISSVGNTVTTGSVYVSGNSNLEGNLIVDTNVLFADVTTNTIGINTSTPNEALTIVGNVSAVGNTITTGNTYVSGNQLIIGSLQVGDIQTGATDNVLTLSGDLVETRLINPRVWDTTAEFLSANNLTVNYIPRYTGPNTLENSTIRDELTSLVIANDVFIQGTITALGSASFVNTVFTTTSSISVVNLGEGPALYVFQSAGPHDVASFYDGDGIEVLHVGNANLGGLGRIGINESNPNKELTVRGSISASGTLDIGSMVTGSISASGNIIAEGIIKPGTVFVTPDPITTLSLSGNDVEFTGHTTTVTITSFVNGTKGATYTLTNKETFAVTISSSPTVYVRGGNNWFSNASNPLYSSIVLLSGYSCSLRADSTDVVSVW